MTPAGQVVTFYSYKGGVGRTFALANVAVLLGRWGFRVLCIDWDLEAPGLTHFFRGHIDAEGSAKLDAPGLVDLLLTFRPPHRRELSWRDYVVEIRSDETPGISLLSAGLQDAGYTRRLQRLNWNALYRKGLGDSLEIMFQDLRRSYDFVLIDSRTGVTDFAGIITAQLPDVLMFLFTANDQSFEGATDVARRAAKARNDLTLGRSGLVLVPVPARFDAKVEHAIAVHWRRRYVDSLGDFYRPWAPRDANIGQLVQMTTIPYVPFWSFGERLSVVEDDVSDPQSINYSLENLAAMLAHRMGQTRLLLDSREEFVSAASRLARRRGRVPSVFISHGGMDVELAKAVALAIQKRGLQPILDRNQPTPDLLSKDGTSKAIARSEHMLLLLGDGLSRSQDVEIRTFLRQAVSDEQSRLLLLTSPGPPDSASLPPFLRQYGIKITRDPDAIAEYVSEAIAHGEELPRENGRIPLVVRLGAAEGEVVEAAHIAAVTRGGLQIDGLTDASGMVELDLDLLDTYTLLIAHPHFEGQHVELFTTGPSLEVRMKGSRHTGSTILRESGMLPVLQTTFQVSLGADGVTTMATDLARVGPEARAPIFRVNEPVLLVDRTDAQVEVILRHATGSTALVDYRVLREGHSNVSQLDGTINKKIRRHLFMSFHAGSDLWRANIVRTVLHEAGYDVFGIPDASYMEQARREGDAVLRRMISTQMRDAGCLLVLVGAQTADRHWVQYEIEAAWEAGRPILGVRIDGLPDMYGRRSEPGSNPFDQIYIGSATPLSEVAPLFAPEGANGIAALDSIRRNIRRWIDRAVAIRSGYS